jgi:magnesium-transporting ATPase (P-type)
MTMNFMVLALAQVFHLGNARDDRPVLRLERALANRLALAAVAAVVVLQALTTLVPPLASLLHVQQLTGFEWLVVAVAASIPAVAGQALKAWHDRDREGHDAPQR